MITLKQYIDKLNKEGGFRTDPLYNTIVTNYKETIAITRGVNMAVLLEGYRVTESEHTTKRREFLLKKIAKPPFDRATNDFVETTDPKLVTINASEEAKGYLAETNFYNYIRTDIVPEKRDDPNGFFVSFVAFEAENKKPTVKPYIANYETVKDWRKDEYLIFTRFVDGKEYFYFISKLEQGRFYQEKTGYAIDKGFYTNFTKPLPFAPFCQLGGELTRDEVGNKYFQSFFDGAISHAVIAARCFSDREATRMAANLVRVMRSKPCGTCKGTGFVIEEEEKHDCKACNGTGKSQVTANIGEVIDLAEEDITAEGVTLDDIIKFIDPPREGVNMNNEAYIQHMKEAEKALNMIFIDEAQSGTAKDIDREHHTAMINKMAKSLYFGAVLNYVKTVEYFVGSRAEENSIALPTDFRNNTSSAILETISELKTSGASMGLLVPLYRKLYNSLYHNDAKSRKIALLMLDYDPLHIYTQMSEKRLAALDEKQYQYSIQLHTVLNRLAYGEMEETFLTTSNESIIKKAESLMELPTTTQLFDEQGRATAN